MPAVSVILSTHNSPHFLEFVLTGYARQDVTDFEVVIADDGSRDPTREFIKQVRPKLPFPLTHVWQPHKGYYGKMSIMNRAIMAAQSDYLILADGDVIPRHDFVKMHLTVRRPNCFIAGADYRLMEQTTKSLTLDDVRSGRAFKLSFLCTIGQPFSRQFVKLLPATPFSLAFDAVNISPARWSGSNAAAWKADLIKVGGFDETIHAPGKDDTELGHRLWNAGVKSRHARHNTICLHMYHGSGNYSSEGRKRNLEILQDTIKTKRTQARQGIPDIKADDHTIDRG